LKIYTKIYCI